MKFDDVRSGLVGDAGREIVGRGLATGDYDNNGKVGVLMVDSRRQTLSSYCDNRNAEHRPLARYPPRRHQRAIGTALAPFLPRTRGNSNNSVNASPMAPICPRQTHVSTSVLEPQLP